MNITHITSSTGKSTNAAQLRKRICGLTSCLFGAIIIAGCASTKVENRERLVYDRLPRPTHIYVYDFASSPADVPRDSAFAGQASAGAVQPSAEQAALGRQLGNTIATELVNRVREMGLPGERGGPGTIPQVNDIVIRGYLVSVDTGSAAKRMTVGFGSGNSELATAVEGFQMTPQGLRKIGSGTLEAKGSKGPGAGLGAAGWLITGSPVGLAASGGMKIYGEASGSATVEGRAKQTAKELAERLKVRFKEEGWIN
jgi:Domain of unknown function (DUF4410)